MKRKAKITAALAILAITLLSADASIVSASRGGRPASNIVIFVKSQGLYYDSIPGPELPWKGPFQKLEMGSNGLETEFGPGDPGYVGGRWWIDVNMDGIQDEGDTYFLCPLLGPGRENP